MAKKTREETPEPLDEGVLTIFVDGSMREHPRRGGIGIRFVWIGEDGRESEPWDHFLESTPGATIQQMELEAPYQALRLAEGRNTPFRLGDFRRIEVRTDSEYVKEGVGRAINYWSRNKWQTSDGNAVLNVPDWKNLLRVMRRFSEQHRLPIRFEWKKGKKGRHAKAVDKLAKSSSNSPIVRRARPSAVRRKITRERVEQGVVLMQGQCLVVRIVEARYLPPPHRRTRYRYEVMNEDSPFFGKVDFSESELELKRGHTYRVRMNEDQAAPRIIELIDEIEEDLTPLLDTLGAIRRPASAREVAEALASAGREMKVDAVKRRLDGLVEAGEITRLRSLGKGKPYVYFAGRGD